MNETLSPAELDAAIARGIWTFAKTMPQDPHWYIVRERYADDPTFTAFVRTIRQNGYPERFKGRIYTMLDVGEFKYWTMFASPEGTTIINRCYIDDARRWPDGKPRYAQ